MQLLLHLLGKVLMSLVSMSHPSGAAKLLCFLPCCWRSLLQNQVQRDDAKERQKVSAGNEIDLFFLPQCQLKNPFDM